MEKKSKICPNCGEKNSPDSKFCDKCGASLVASEGKKGAQVCGACGAENKADAKYCEKCGTALTGQAAQAQNGPGRGNRGFGTSRNRWLIILIPIIAIVAFYVISSLTAQSTTSWNLAAGQNITLPGGYYSIAYTNLSTTNTTLYGEFEANVTTTWFAGPTAPLDAFLSSNNDNTSSIQGYIIENTTTATINITLPAGNYTVAFWGNGFTADNVIFPDGFNVTWP